MTERRKHIFFWENKAAGAILRCAVIRRRSCKTMFKYSLLCCNALDTAREQRFLYAFGCIFQPGCRCGRENICQSRADAAMIFIQPALLFAREHFRYDSVEIYRSEGQCFKAVKSRTKRTAEHEVFCAHSESSGEISAGFVGNDRADGDRRERGGGAYPSGTFVYNEHMSYAVACAVSEVQVFLLQRSTGYGVQLPTVRSSRKYRTGEIYVPFEHQSENPLFFLRKLSERDCTSYVSGAARVVTARV